MLGALRRFLVLLADGCEISSGGLNTPESGFSSETLEDIILLGWIRSGRKQYNYIDTSSTWSGEPEDVHHVIVAVEATALLITQSTSLSVQLGLRKASNETHVGDQDLRRPWWSANVPSIFSMRCTPMRGGIAPFQPTQKSTALIGHRPRVLSLCLAHRGLDLGCRFLAMFFFSVTV